jgi:hypothetical protein
MEKGQRQVSRRQYTAQTNARLLAGGILILFVVGDGLIYWLYGRGAALMGLLCLLAGLAPLAIIWLVLRVIDWIVQRANE